MLWRNCLWELRGYAVMRCHRFVWPLRENLSMLVRQMMPKQNAMGRLGVFLLVTISLIGTTGCPFVGFAYEDEVAADYRVVGLERLEDVRIERGDAGQVVAPMVFAYGWNDDFILAKQHPVRDWPKVDTGTTYWFIIEVQSGKVHGPLMEEQYVELRQALGIPLDLTFTRSVARRSKQERGTFTPVLAGFVLVLGITGYLVYRKCQAGKKGGKGAH